ncbi:M50 family metallopeptidase [Plantactinospora sp. GCM10030261]|uniref:M50 family metallopeptidase n=1 Tax=Plantactinospora sp. GCM10030261 TaxID=3273420 RepID=UPI003623583E
MRETAARGPARTGLSVGRVFGVPVHLHVSLVLLAALVAVTYGETASRDLGLTAASGYLVGLAFAGCLVGSVLLHELGHAVAARRFGIGVRGITLELLGGYTEMDRDAPAPRVDLVISLAGPAVSLLLGLGAVGAAIGLPDGTVADRLAALLAAANLVVAVFNLLPGLPLDGGRALRAAVWGITRDRHRGTELAGWGGRVLAVAAVTVVLALTLRGVLRPFGLVLMLLVAVVLWRGASQSIRAARIGRRSPLVDLRRLARPVLTVPAGTPLAEAQRRAGAAAGPTALGVADGGGRLVALVDTTAAAAVPAERRPWIAVDMVARRLAAVPGLPVGLPGEDVLRAVQEHPGSQYVVTAGEDVVGVLHLDDLARVLEPHDER